MLIGGIATACHVHESANRLVPLLRHNFAVWGTVHMSKLSTQGSSVHPMQ